MEELLTLKQEYLNREEMWLTSISEQHPAERETKENLKRKKKLSRTFLIHHKSCYLHPDYQFRKGIQTSTQITLKVAKEKGPKGTMHSQYPMPNCFQYWSRNTRFPSYRLSLESLHIRNGMTSVLDVNTMAGLRDILQKIAHHSKTKVQALIDADPAKFQGPLKVFQG